MPKRKSKYEPVEGAKLLEDYDPGAEKDEVFKALRKVELANAKKPNGSLDRASSKT